MSSSSFRVKVVRVLCDGCERGVADVYCAHCKVTSCKKCKSKYHAACSQSFDLTGSAAVLALCHACRARPVHRYSRNEAFALCHDCRNNHKSDKSDKDVASKRASSSVSRASFHVHSHERHRKSPSPRRSRATQSPRKARSSRHLVASSGDDTTEGEAAFSRESSAE